MRILQIYRKDSIWKFEQIGERFLFSIRDEHILEIYKRDPITGEESLHAGFQDWDYFIVDEPENSSNLCEPIF